MTGKPLGEALGEPGQGLGGAWKEALGEGVRKPEGEPEGEGWEELGWFLGVALGEPGGRRGRAAANFQSSKLSKVQTFKVSNFQSFKLSKFENWWFETLKHFSNFESLKD